MSPVHAHLSECLPEGGVGEGLDAGDEPDLVEDAQHTLTQLITHIICKEDKYLISELQKILYCREHSTLLARSYVCRCSQ
jgi:hypothetical protein